MADAIDDDTTQAVLKAWQSDQETLPELFKQLPVVGRLKSTTPGADYAATGPTCELESKYDSRQSAAAGGVWIDKRRVTFTVRGIRADVVAAVKAIRAVFGLMLGQKGGAPFALPSGARFMAWMPVNGDEIKQDKDAKAGKDVWQGEIVGLVWSVRNG